MRVLVNNLIDAQLFLVLDITASGRAEIIMDCIILINNITRFLVFISTEVREAQQIKFTMRNNTKTKTKLIR